MPRYVFVGGLHRSGTSLTARLIAGIDGVSAIEGAPVPENEGVYLQGAIPHDALAGRPLAFATDPQQHLTEKSAFNTLATRQRLDHDWAPWFDEEAPWRVEKSPVNLTRMRLLQQLFPLAQFVVVLRHPEMVAAATRKWVDLDQTSMIDHWLDAHDIVRTDIERLHAVMVLRYEDIVANPQQAVAMLASFIGQEGCGVKPGEKIVNGNDRYQGAVPMDEDQSRRAAVWGYDQDGVVRPWQPVVRHPLRTIRQAVQSKRATDQG
ncbi:sulfotransferase [Sulfitobacter sp. S190]|uniref:sulfotransferase family protein n=1 Tax=Sulfitobacter sp. S190 TaxID=2867022 RepID=UPI0021A74BFB|nr:sulfotransferase [Sulfitobacter sp. S190]